MPFIDENFTERCPFCDFGINPCTQFKSGAVALFDCDGNICPEFDLCGDILKDYEKGLFEENWHEYELTDRAGRMCGHSVTLPYKY